MKINNTSHQVPEENELLDQPSIVSSSRMGGRDVTSSNANYPSAIVPGAAPHGGAVSGVQTL